MNKIFSFINFLIENFSRYKKIGNGQVFVFTMGKVGSSVIYEGLKNCYQLHNFDPEPPAKYFSCRFTPFLRRYIFESLRWKFFYAKASKHLKRNIKLKRKIKILSIVRDPVARNLSAFFQNLDATQINDNINDLILDFQSLENHFLPLYWFDLEVKRHLGINVYDFPFDPVKGWSTFNYENFDFMVIQLDKLNSLELEIRDFVEDDGFKLKNNSKEANKASNKWYAEHYSELKNSINFSDSFLDIMYNSQFSKHFFSSEQISEMRAKWNVSD